MKTYPTSQFTLLFGLTTVVAALPMLANTSFFILWLSVVALFFLIAAFDLFMSVSGDELDATLRPSRAFYLGEPAAFDLSFAGPDNFSFEFRMDVDGPVAAPKTQRFVTGESTAAQYLVTPERRGTIDARRLWVRWKTRLGLFHRTRVFETNASVLVLPNIEAVKRSAIQWSKNNTFLAGVHTQKYLSDGSEFETLRKYVRGMDHRAIDWKASAKHATLLSREFRAERNQPVIVAIDTGRLMSESVHDIPKVDHAINAGLLLGYVSLRIGDRVGLMGFDEKVRLFRKPVSGVRAYHQLTSAASMLDYGSGETNFTVALSELASTMKRRSIVVVFTDFTDTIGAELLLDNMLRLSRRHVVLFVAIRNPEIDAVAGVEPNQLEDMMKSVVATQLVQERQKVIQELSRKGIFCVDATPDELHLNVLNAYLDIHRRELL